MEGYEQSTEDIWSILLEFGLIDDPLLQLFVTGHWWCKSPAKVTRCVTIEKSKLFLVIPKTLSVIPYPYNYLVSYTLSLKLLCQVSLIPKTPNRASNIARKILHHSLFTEVNKPNYRVRALQVSDGKRCSFHISLSISHPRYALDVHRSGFKFCQDTHLIHNKS